jgi:hypothetical protein
VFVVWRRSTEDVFFFFFFFFFFVIGYAKGGDVGDFIIALLVIKTRCVIPTTLRGIVLTPLGCRLCAGWWGRSSVKRVVCIFPDRAKTPLRTGFPISRIVCGGRGRGRGRRRTGIIGSWCGCHFVCFTFALFIFGSSCKGCLIFNLSKVFNFLQSMVFLYILSI